MICPDDLQAGRLSRLFFIFTASFADSRIIMDFFVIHRVFFLHKKYRYSFTYSGILSSHLKLFFYFCM